MSARKYPDAVYTAVAAHDLGDTLTRRQIEAVLDTAGKLLIADELSKQATRIADSAKAWGDPAPGSAAYAMAGVLVDVVVELRERAAELDGDRLASASGEGVAR